MKRPYFFPMITAWICFFCLAAGAVHAQPSVVGLWEFSQAANLTKASVGSDLVLIGEQRTVTGIRSGDGAVEIPTGSYYQANHGIVANGGGNYVNEFTLVFDFRLPALGVWYSFYNTDSANSNDGEAFVNPSGNIGVGDTGYSAQAIADQTWYRLVITANLSAGGLNYYLDGSLLLASKGRGTDDRFSWYTANDETPWVVLLGDNDGDDAAIQVSTLAIFDVMLNPLEVADLGKAGDPVVVQPHDLVAPDRPVITAMDPAEPRGVDDITLSASPFLSASGNSHAGSVWELSFDPAFVNEGDQTILRHVEIDGPVTTFTVENSFLPLNQPVYARVRYVDNVGNQSSFSEPYLFQLKNPAGLVVLYEEDFETTAINGLPSGWKAVTYTQDATGMELDYFNPQLRGWSVQEEEYLNTLLYYPSYEGDSASVNQIGVPIVEGKFVYADSGNYASFAVIYETYLVSPLYNVGDASMIVITFSSNYVQNQDNIASLEYSVDGGDYTDSGATGTWHPVLYYLEPTDLLTDEEGNFSAELTLLGEAEGSGIEYGFYTLAPEYVADLQELAPYFAARQDDGYKDGKRFEKHRLPLADHKTQVRFRWGFMGTWSWYWGVDHVQIWGDNGTGIGDWSLF